ncbi:MAG TPA: flagellar biosynthesis anti-sigma factor FlgM [Steroidobacteraceae bacterium]|nr:flagellar biosynthesis anti-sigma factor FlgM [Steroidobacteraceae bacterium]
MAGKLSGVEPASTPAIGTGGPVASAPGAAGAASNASSASNASGTPQQVQAQATENVHITDAASQLAGLEQALSAQPAIDAGRVAEVSRALASGSYTIDPDRIAAGLLRSEQTLAQLSPAEG